MLGKNIFNVDYGDFYKFSVSIGILGFIIFILFTYYSYLLFEGLIKIILISVCIVFSLFFFGWFLWAINKWREKQKILDDKLKLELDILKANKEKLINELSTNESLDFFGNKNYSITIPLKDLQKNQVRKKLNI